MNKNATDTTKKIRCVYGHCVIMTAKSDRWFPKFLSGDMLLRDEPNLCSRCFNRISEMHSAQKYSKIKTWLTTAGWKRLEKYKRIKKKWDYFYIKMNLTIMGRTINQRNE